MTFEGFVEHFPRKANVAIIFTNFVGQMDLYAQNAKALFIGQ